MTSVIARLPLAMLSIGLMVHIQRLTRSFAAAGVVTAAYGIAVGLGGPVLGRLVDRRGQTVVLLATGSIAGALLGAITVLPAHVSLVLPTVIAAARAGHGTTADAAPLLALWGAGSFVSGLLVSRFGRDLGTAAGLTRWPAALAAVHLALIPAAGSVGALAIALPLAGVSIAPTESTVYERVEAAAPAGTVTEAFSWLLTAIEVGAALGAAAGGALVDRVGPAAAFGLGASTCALAALITASHTPRLAVGRRTPHLDAPSPAK